MPFGWTNPLALRIGGPDTRTQRAYHALRSAVGRGGAGPEGGLEDLWTMIEARAIASSHALVERAGNQAWPQTMTDNLGLWELGLGLPEAPTLVERQQSVGRALTDRIDATIPGLRESLHEIDPAFSIDSITHDESATTYEGRSFGPLPGVSDIPYGTGYASARLATGYANYSDHLTLRVRYTLADEETTIPDTVLGAATDLLCDALPSWCDFEIYTLADGDDGEGFYLDGGDDGDSLLDQTAFDE